MRSCGPRTSATATRTTTRGGRRRRTRRTSGPRTPQRRPRPREYRSAHASARRRVARFIRLRSRRLNVELADQSHEACSQRSPRGCRRLEVSGAIDERKPAYPLLDETERDRIREVVLEEPLPFGESLTLLFGCTKEVFEAGRAHHERLALGGPRGPPRRGRVHDDPNSGYSSTCEPKGERVPEHER